MKLNLKKLASVLVSSLLVATGLVAVSAAPSQAVTGPADGTIRLVSPAIDTATNGTDLQTDADYFVNNYGYKPGLRFKQTYATYGTTLTLVYEARNSADALETSGTMQLVVNKQYSNSNASFSTTSNNSVSNTISGSAVDVVLTAPIGSNGRATFYLTNTNTASEAETITGLTAAPPASGKRYTQVMPSLSSLPNAGVDLNEFHFYNQIVPTQAPLTATSTLLDFSSNLHTIVNFDNSSASVVKPSESATDCSPVMKVSKAVIGWSGTEYAVSRVARFADRKLTSSANSVMTVNMYAPEAGKKVFFKIGRNGVDAGVDYEFTVVTPGWQRMSIDFGPIQSAGSWNATWSSSHEYTDLFVGVDFRGSGTGKDYYFDDFAFNGATTPALGSVVSCEPKPSKYIWSPYFDEDKKGFYPHLRLEKSFLNEKLDGTWWDGVWQYRDADTRAYLKYIPVGSTFALTYNVTDEYGHPYVGAKVSLIVNANYSCSKTFFAYEGSLIGPDDCAGGGETELPAKTVDANGRVTFVLTNTNTTGEAMPADLNGAPNPATKELGTNIKPHVVGAKQEGFDMLFAHFVEPAGLSKATGPGAASATIGSGSVSEFTLTDDAGKALANTDVKYFVNGFDSKAGFARTDSAGKVRIHSTNSAGLEGMQTVGVSLIRDGKLPLAATATINWVAPELAIAASGSANSVVVKVAGAAGKSVKITIAGKVYTRVANSANAEFSIATSAGKKAVKVAVSGKSLSKSVTVTKK